MVCQVARRPAAPMQELCAPRVATGDLLDGMATSHLYTRAVRPAVRDRPFSVATRHRSYRVPTLV